MREGRLTRRHGSATASTKWGLHCCPPSPLKLHKYHDASVNERATHMQPQSALDRCLCQWRHGTLHLLPPASQPALLQQGQHFMRAAAAPALQSQFGAWRSKGEQWMCPAGRCPHTGSWRGTWGKQNHAQTLRAAARIWQEPCHVFILHLGWHAGRFHLRPQ